MTRLKISINSIERSIDVNDEELSNFKIITDSLNTKTNELMVKSGKISDTLLLFLLLLINANKKEKIFNNFEENITKLTKTIAPLFNEQNTLNSIFTTNYENDQTLNNVINKKEILDSQLVLSNIIIENETENLKELNFKEENNSNLLKILDEQKENNEETINFINEIIKFIEKLANNINNF